MCKIYHRPELQVGAGKSIYTSGKDTTAAAVTALS